MKIIGEVSFDEALHNWLKGEWYKPEYDRFRESIAQNILNEPDFTNPGENNIRSTLFYHGRHPMWHPTIALAKWFKVKLIKGDANRIYHCYCAEWGPITGNSYQVTRTIQNLNGTISDPISRQIVQTVNNIQAGLNDTSVVNGLIMIGRNLDSNLTVIEGNHRFTAICSKHRNKEDEKIISEYAYLGINPAFNQYQFHFPN